MLGNYVHARIPFAANNADHRKMNIFGFRAQVDW
jgi:hypothetical protein